MAQLIGINHVALEVGNVEEALAWYGRFFELVAATGRCGSDEWVQGVLNDQRR